MDILIIVGITVALIVALWFMSSTSTTFNYAQFIPDSSKSNPAYTAGRVGWSWNKFTKVNPQLVSNSKQYVQQQYLWQLGRVDRYAKKS